MMTSAQIRQSYLDFFREKQHTIVPSASLMPGSPNLLFTNAGMNQFVPIFLGERKADVSKWAGAVPSSDTRAADTQKCIRAGGKHNDLDDVGLDTYHHTFFEMLGNWSFGDYFKKEAIEWAWELVVGRWEFPAERLYATIYNPDKTKGDPADRDEEAWNAWAEKFSAAGLDPAVHIVNGNKKDNFWMMGDTGPCGPCSELHVDLTPAGDTKGALVNVGDARCIEIWNLVFIQFNANPDGTFSPLPAKHVDTGMGFERVASIIQGTKGFTDFASAKISNYETDIFRPIFDELEKMSGCKYTSTLPGAVGRLCETAGDGAPQASDTDVLQIQTDIAFRVIADHIRTLSFAIADGIQPGNTDRNYVLRRILRRAVRYGRTLGFAEPFFYKLVDVLARTMGDVFPEIRAKQKHVEEVLKREEDAFNKTLDVGMRMFETFVVESSSRWRGKQLLEIDPTGITRESLFAPDLTVPETGKIAGSRAFELYDTYGFPLDLTELMARERGMTVDVAGFEKLMEEQRARARAAQKKEVITVSDDNLQVAPTKFLGYDFLETEAVVEAVTPGKKEGELNVVLDRTACYAEMGGQVGDHGLLHIPGHDNSEVGRLAVLDTQKRGDVFIHRAKLADGRPPEPGEAVRIAVDAGRRGAIQRHHTVTHLLHWALHEVVSHDATQKGSFVGADKLTFDFNSAALTPDQVAAIEKLVNEKIVENAAVSWTEVPYAEVKKHPAIMQFFGDKYGDTVRVVQVGGSKGAFDGWSMELCGGTHTRATGEIGLFRIVSEAAIAAGVRRIEAVAGLTAYDFAHADAERLKVLAAKLNAPLVEIEKKLDAMLAQQKELEKSLKAAQQREAAGRAKDLLASAETINGTPAIIANLGDAGGDALQTVADALKSGGFKGVIVLGGAANNAVALVASVSSDFTAKAQAGKIIQAIAPIVGGKGGGKPDNARGGGKDASKLDEALAKSKALLG
jgi:alanyl-tRNA synthetase